MGAVPGVLVVLALTVTGCTPSAPEYRRVTADPETVRIPLTDVAREGVTFRTFRHDGKNVNFLVRTDGRGALHVHLDACYSCWRYRRGFVVEDASLVCIACRLSYPLEDEMWDFIGACAPIPIPFSVEDDAVVLQRPVLEKAARYF